jgi:tetratricopeptide (TPR) repeat protein
VWTAADFFANRRAGKIILATATGFILAALLVLTVRQISFWRDTITLFTHNLAVTPHNASAQFSLGLGYEHAGDTNRAIVSYRAAKSMEPRDFQNRRNLANLLTLSGEPAAAAAEYLALIAEEPEQYQNHQAYAGLLTAQNRWEEARAELEATVRLNPSATEALNNLAWALVTDPRVEIRDGQRAAQLAQRACELTQFQKTIYLGTLAAALAEAGKFNEAIATAQRACELAQKNKETNLLQRNQELLERYRQRRTARD